MDLSQDAQRRIHDSIMAEINDLEEVVMNNELKFLMQKYVQNKGVADGIICCIEELSELTKVLTKYLRVDDKFSIDNLAEELAHVRALTTFIQHRFGIPDDLIEEEQIAVIKRFLEEEKVCL